MTSKRIRTRIGLFQYANFNKICWGSESKDVAIVHRHVTHKSWMSSRAQSRLSWPVLTSLNFRPLLSGEAGYYLTLLSSSIHFLKTFKIVENEDERADAAKETDPTSVRPLNNMSRNLVDLLFSETWILLTERRFYFYLLLTWRSLYIIGCNGWTITEKYNICYLITCQSVPIVTPTLCCRIWGSL